MSGIITSSKGETLRFDVVMEEKFSPKNAVTDFPVEDGTVFSDHIQRQPLTFTVVAILSTTPFSDTPVSLTRLTDATEFLDRAAADILSYTSTRFGLIERLSLESWEHTNDVMERLEFTLGFKQIRIAVAEIVSIPRPQKVGAKPPRDCGEQPHKEDIPIEDPKGQGKEIVEDEDNRSMAKKAVDQAEDFLDSASSFFD